MDTSPSDTSSRGSVLLQTGKIKETLEGIPIFPCESCLGGCLIVNLTHEHQNFMHGSLFRLNPSNSSKMTQSQPLVGRVMWHLSRLQVLLPHSLLWNEEGGSVLLWGHGIVPQVTDEEEFRVFLAEFTVCTGAALPNLLLFRLHTHW